MLFTTSTFTLKWSESVCAVCSTTLKFVELCADQWARSALTPERLCEKLARNCRMLFSAFDGSAPIRISNSAALLVGMSWLFCSADPACGVGATCISPVKFLRRSPVFRPFIRPRAGLRHRPTLRVEQSYGRRQIEIERQHGIAN